MTDPNFPDRPDHPDFWRLSEAVMHNDTMADNGASVQDILGDLGIADANSVGYMAGQRVMRAVHHNFLSEEVRALFTSLYLDAFALGLRVAQKDQP